MQNDTVAPAGQEADTKDDGGMHKSLPYVIFSAMKLAGISEGQMRELSKPENAPLLRRAANGLGTRKSIDDASSGDASRMALTS